MEQVSKKSKESSPQFVLLSDGVKMPMIGLGTWKSKKNETKTAVSIAFTKGAYHMVDTANDYDNEPEVGEAIQELLKSGVKREDMFIQAKLWNSNHKKEHVKPDLMATLKDLGVTYVDSFIIHWPQACPSQGKLALRTNGSRCAPKAEGTMFPAEEDGCYSKDDETSFTETWNAMEQLKEEVKRERERKKEGE